MISICFSHCDHSKIKVKAIFPSLFVWFFLVLFGAFRPPRKFFTELDPSPFPVKDCKV